ncbi:MlaD family protein [Nocardia sp. NBC_01388]|uniref:MlaD family protein n=1 Tax=Nocardia sp. NBC_01388 TaxID=2903596 RepID=UPI0032478C03
MPLNYAMPGVQVRQRGARLTGVIAVVVTVLAVTASRLVATGADPGTLRVVLRTEQVGPGIETGTDVRLDGIKVGAVESINAEPAGYQRVALNLRGNELFGLTDALHVDYAPGNLFGISEIELLPGQGGAALADHTVVDLTGDQANRVVDATISSLLRSIGQLTQDVLTPQLASVLAMVARESHAFTPLIQAIVVSVRAVADTQKLPTSYLLTQLGDSLAGLPSTVNGLVELLYGAYTNTDLRSDAAHKEFDATIAMVKDNLVPGITTVLGTGGANFTQHAAALVPILDAITQTVPAPTRTGADLGELLDRLDRSFRPTPGGPTLAVDLRLVPVLAAGGVR